MRTLFFTLALGAMGGCVPGDGKPSSIERCNGLDDNGDGLIDEGFPDADGDGLADCLDETCAPEPPPPGIVEVEASCVEPVEVEDETEMAVEWCFAEDTWSAQTMPAVGDVTGDGAPEVATILFDGTLVLLDGATGEAQWRRSGFSVVGGVAVADVDADGDSEILALTSDRRGAALDGDGETVWQSDVLNVSLSAQPTVADLDSDGAPEVIFWNTVLNGEDGSLVSELAYPTAAWTAPMVVDLDQDGEAEIVLGNYVSHQDGTVLWSLGTPVATAFYAPVNADDDDDAELLWVADHTSTIRDTDGSLLVTLDLDLDYAAPPCVADFDGDGEQEMGIPTPDQVRVVELNGEVRWGAATEDTGSAGCAAFDFDDDGAFELVLADQSSVKVYDGATGEVRFHTATHGSGTAFEIPVIADVDLDGSAEILATSTMSPCMGVGAFGHPLSAWAESGTSWGVHDYTSENVLDDGSVPAFPEPSWAHGGAFRGRPSTGRHARPEAGDPVANLSVEAVDWCVSGCPSGTLTVSVQVANRGPADAPAGVSLTLLAFAGDERFAVDTVALDAVPSGVALGGVTLSGPASSFGPEGFLIQVNDAEGSELSECSLADNRFTSGEPVCAL